ncbi:hypothetical protein JYU34_010504 [Plutella xylostella]|uniref:Uncharacterized protein n=1 Tax=Plutella xylostella TaxID=51655 RepID=A0ABQ7QM91_PLUXY|nr:hypothetical protein JYU34_010504 [Plutella xylostella]
MVRYGVMVRSTNSSDRKVSSLQILKDAIKTLEKLKYVDSTGKEKTVPFIQNFIVTLKSLMRLFQIFKSQNIKIMLPRYFNSDPIENFFGQVRPYNYRNNDSSCHSFNCN